jgi:hypothetical protein
LEIGFWGISPKLGQILGLGRNPGKGPAIKYFKRLCCCQMSIPNWPDSSINTKQQSIGTEAAERQDADWIGL